MSTEEKTVVTISNGITLAQILSKEADLVDEDTQEMDEGADEETTQTAQEGFCIECEGNLRN